MEFIIHRRYNTNNTEKVNGSIFIYGFYIICEMLYYQLKVYCDRLRIYIVTTKGITKETEQWNNKPREEITYNTEKYLI